MLFGFSLQNRFYILLNLSKSMNKTFKKNCNCKVVRDKYHCLFVCKENTLKESRENFIYNELLNINVNFRNCDYKTLFCYILSLNDDSHF